MVVVADGGRWLWSRTYAGPATSSGKGLEGNPVYPCAKLKLDQLFLHWLGLPESQNLVSSIPALFTKPLKERPTLGMEASQLQRYWKLRPPLVCMHVEYAC